MKQGEGRHEKFNFWVWLGTRVKNLLEKFGAATLAILILGTVLGFCFRFIYRNLREFIEDENKLSEWSEQNSRIEVGKLIPLQDTEEGIEFYQLLEDISKGSGRLSFIVQVDEDGGILKVGERVDSEDIILVDSIIETPRIVLKSSYCARKIHTDGMTVTEYLRSWLGSSYGDRVYIYIKKDQTVRYIKKEG